MNLAPACTCGGFTHPQLGTVSHLAACPANVGLTYTPPPQPREGTTFSRMCARGQHLVRVDRGHMLDREGNATNLWAHVECCADCIAARR